MVCIDCTHMIRVWTRALTPNTEQPYQPGGGPCAGGRPASCQVSIRRSIPEQERGASATRQRDQSAHAVGVRETWLLQTDTQVLASLHGCS